ncbi:hypothetical protein SAMN05421869_14422 [Nonomuraea jiangxiensis]|uniref:Uncharacterized protein n=1 Tax=Nonomuraea jiangxiensis TaxID=633440 RepID=A0A1G9TB14_9ACTN|nr:hypothetical protein SAMN05421869_14422 [Nonomuraea jiangxiensis]
MVITVVVWDISTMNVAVLLLGCRIALVASSATMSSASS